MEGKIDVLGDIYIYREMLTDNRFLILTYDQPMRTFYQKIISESEWAATMPNFTLIELDSIIRICCHGQEGYTL